MDINKIDPYLTLKNSNPEVYRKAIMYAECLNINNKLGLKVASDVERYFVHFALELIKEIKNECHI